MNALKEANATWQSIDCLGRIKSDGKALIIRIIVVVAFLLMPNEKQAAGLKITLENLMGNDKLLVEFI